MSTINCDSCANLREYAPEFVQNGVTDTVAASLKNNTGFNPALTVTRDDCEDLNDANDCLIGRMQDEVEAYDVCDWKEFMSKLLPNQYELLKAIIANDCGQWAMLDRLCSGLDGLARSFYGSGMRRLRCKWVPEIYDRLNTYGGWANRDDIYIFTYFGIESAAGCKTMASPFVRIRWGMDSEESIWPESGSAEITSLTAGEVIATITKQELVDAGLTETAWVRLARSTGALMTAYVNNATLYLSARAKVTINGVTYNSDIGERFGDDVLAVYVRKFIGTDTAGVWLSIPAGNPMEFVAML